MKPPLLLLLAFAQCTTSHASPKPNILFFLADDQRNDVLGCYGNHLIKTPTIDRLASEGIRFDNAFCEVPICAASRASLFSGLTQRSHGYNFGELPVPAKYIATSYPVLLKAAGYRIGFAGKYGMSFGKPGLKKQFDFFKAINRTPYLKKMPDGSRRHETDLCADAAIKFIQTNPVDQPFCMSVSFNASHAEDNDRRPGYHFQWPESADGLYEDIVIPAPRLADKKYNQALPPFLRDAKNLNTLRYYWRWDTPGKYQTNIRAYYRMITGIDNAIARVLDSLKERHLDQNTIVIYSADNGYMMGDRSTAGKWNHYEQSLRIPLVVFDPRLPEKLRGRAITALVSNIDMAPSFIDFAGLPVSNVHQGLSISPLVQGNATNHWRDAIYCEHRFRMFNNWHGVRTERYKFAVYYDEPGGPYECLYDLQKDPDELVNLAKNPEYAKLRSQMNKRLESYQKAYPPAPAKAAKQPKRTGK
ncbi:MAG: sulfatase [Akkermansiaceae bacterium]|nr:sulfatase [Akkermansiaceae bacterium]